MADLPSLEGIKATVEATYPTPIAAVFRRCRVASREDLGGRHKGLIDLFEVLVKFLCIAGLQEARSVIPKFKDRLPQKEKTLEFLKRPSIGGWVGLLRILCGLSPGAVQPTWLPKIAEWYGQAKTPGNTAALSLLGGIEGLSYEKRTQTPNAEMCNALVTYRNKQLAHAASIRDEELEKRLPILEGVLAHLLSSASFLGEMTTFFSERVEVAENNRWKVHAARLNGATEEPATYVCPDKPDLSEVYLVDRSDGAPVPLGPFILWRMNEELKRSEIYFYNDAWRTKLEYLSYTSGSYHYHKELHSGFDDLIQLKLKPGVEEDAYRFMPPEERAERAEELYKRAMVLVTEERYEDALEALEQSAAYERRAETFLVMARAQRELGDPPDAVRQTLQSCLDIDPANAAAAEVLQGLDAAGEAEADAPGEEDTRSLVAPTLFHALTPSVVRRWTPAWWLGLLVGWYVSSAGVEYATGHIEGLLPNLMQFLMSVLGMALVVAGRSLVLRLQLPLSLQLDSMRLERFNKWFGEQLVSVFGAFDVRDGEIAFAGSLRKDRAYYAIHLAFALLIAVSGFLLAELHRFPPLLMAKRWVDNIIPLSFVAFVVVRYVVMSTLFVYRFSRLSLKPMLTKINDDGLRSFGPLTVANVSVVSVIWALLMVHAATVVTLGSHGDFFLMGVGTIIIMVWSVGMPLAIRRAAREAKSKSVHAYSAHIEKAFRAFLEDPSDDDKLAVYEKLVKNQKVIRRIPTWPLSWKETIFVVLGSNLVLLAVDAWYITVRTGRWPAVVDWIRGLL